MWQLIPPGSHFDFIGKAKPYMALSLFCFGGQVIHNFAFALLVGMIAGVYSTIFISSPILVYWQQYALRPQTRSRLVASSH